MSPDTPPHRLDPGFDLDVEALRAAGFVGSWNTDVPAGRSVLDPGAAAVLAGDPALAGRPLPLEAALACIHEDDRPWVFERIGQVRRSGGPFSAEFRVRTRTDGIRWILNRGAIAPDANGRMRGRGSYLDTTDAHHGASASILPLDLAGRPGADPLDIAARHYVAGREAIDRTGDPLLRLVSDMLLLEVGRALARRQTP